METFEFEGLGATDWCSFQPGLCQGRVGVGVVVEAKSLGSGVQGHDLAVGPAGVWGMLAGPSPAGASGMLADPSPTCAWGWLACWLAPHLQV